MNTIRIRQAVLSAVLLCVGTSAGAAVTGGGALPWEGPLQTLVDSLTGPVAFSGSAIALVVAFLTLAFNNDLTGMGRYLVYLAMAVSALLFITNLLTALFGAGADTASPLIAMQVLSTFFYIALCVALAALQWIAWLSIKRVWMWWRQQRQLANRSTIKGRAIQCHAIFKSISTETTLMARPGVR